MAALVYHNLPPRTFRLENSFRMMYARELVYLEKHIRVLRNDAERA